MTHRPLNPDPSIKSPADWDRKLDELEQRRGERTQPPIVAECQHDWRAIKCSDPIDLLECQHCGATRKAPCDPSRVMHVSRQAQRRKSTKTESTLQERVAISKLQALARKWPQSLTLFLSGGKLQVMKGGIVVETIHGIPNDGGDPGENVNE